MSLSSAVVSLQKITRENLDNILDLQVTDAQKNFIASNAESIAQAHFYPEVAWFRAIYADNIPVGFVMLEDNRTKSYYSLWRLMIDAQFQQQGIGRKVIELVLKEVKTRPGAKILFTSCVSGEGNPIKFYEKMGFTRTGKTDEDREVILQYKL